MRPGRSSTSRFRTVPANKNAADAYYFINVTGRGQLIDWDASLKRGPTSGIGGKRYYSLKRRLDQWAMRSPPPDHQAIWHEVHREIDDLVYIGSGTHVFVTDALRDTLEAVFPGQVRLFPIRELRPILPRNHSRRAAHICPPSAARLTRPE
jgi:hypothetical protein